jgi:2-polyprenyl-3-methyl-5-hydroxy-6-metoxy-1,4-benzoquinol methylase
MTQLINGQGGDESQSRKTYFQAIKNLPEESVDCLDVGSGNVLEFEKILHQHRKHKDKVDCVDQLSLSLSLSRKVYRQFYVRDVNQPFNLKKKYDVVFCFEVIEHVDNTDVLLQNCYKHLKPNGLLMLSAPNLASFYSRIELLFGLQPHLLEVSNLKANFGTGIFGKLNNSHNKPIHHIRGITYKAMKELLTSQYFQIVKIQSSSSKSKSVPVPASFSSSVLYICKKT